MKRTVELTWYLIYVHTMCCTNDFNVQNVWTDCSVVKMFIYKGYVMAFMLELYSFVLIPMSSRQD